MSDPWLIPPRTRSRVVARRGTPHLATLFEGFTAYLAVERQCRPGTIATYRSCFADFLRLAEGNPSTAVPIFRFTADLVRAYQYHLAERGLSATTVRLRVAVLASLARWAVRRGKLLANPVASLVRPRTPAKLPTTLRWDAVPELLDRCGIRRDRAIVALMAYGGLRRSEVVTLDIADFDPGFGLRRVHAPRRANYTSKYISDQPIRAQIRAGHLDPACGISWHIATKSGRATKFLGIVSTIWGAQNPASKFRSGFVGPYLHPYSLAALGYRPGNWQGRSIYVCIRCRSGVGAAKREAGRKVAKARKSRRSQLQAAAEAS